MATKGKTAFSHMQFANKFGFSLFFLSKKFQLRAKGCVQNLLLSSSNLKSLKQVSTHLVCSIGG